MLSLLAACMHLIAAQASQDIKDIKQTPKGAEITFANGDKVFEPLPVRPMCPLRIGGVFTRGLGDSSDPDEDSAHNGTKISATKALWIARNCDVVAISPTNTSPQIFTSIRHAAPLFTPLLYLYASSMYESDSHAASVGGWKPELANWTLKAADGREVPYPDPAGHWMDFSSADWGHFWRDRVNVLTHYYGADGAVAAELPIGNTFVTAKLKDYSTTSDRAAATASWLQAAHAPGTFLLVPSALGFNAVADHATLPPPPGSERVSLTGRLWDDYFPYYDGCWSEGWIRPYWGKGPAPEKVWAMEMDAADRLSVSGGIFIAGAAYKDLSELEYNVASALLIEHRQGRFVLQPMPLTSNRPPDAGFSLEVVRREVELHRSYFDIPLGVPLESRKLTQVAQGSAWLRPFQHGMVFVNSSDTSTAILLLSGLMKRLDGSQVRKVVMPPHSGVVLQYISGPAPGKAKPAHMPHVEIKHVPVPGN